MGRQKVKKDKSGSGKSFIYRNTDDLIGIMDSRGEAEKYKAAMETCYPDSTFDVVGSLRSANKKEG
jgi:hypothetical protein